MEFKQNYIPGTPGILTQAEARQVFDVYEEIAQRSPINVGEDILSTAIFTYVSGTDHGYIELDNKIVMENDVALLLWPTGKAITAAPISIYDSNDNWKGTLLDIETGEFVNSMFFKRDTVYGIHHDKTLNKYYVHHLIVKNSDDIFSNVDVIPEKLRYKASGSLKLEHESCFSVEVKKGEWLDVVGYTSLFINHARLSEDKGFVRIDKLRNKNTFTGNVEVTDTGTGWKYTFEIDPVYNFGFINYTVYGEEPVTLPTTDAKNCTVTHNLKTRYNLNAVGYNGTIRPNMTPYGEFPPRITPAGDMVLDYAGSPTFGRTWISSFDGTKKVDGYDIKPVEDWLVTSGLTAQEAGAALTSQYNDVYNPNSPYRTREATDYYRAKGIEGTDDPRALVVKGDLQINDTWVGADETFFGNLAGNTLNFNNADTGVHATYASDIYYFRFSQGTASSSGTLSKYNHYKITSAGSYIMNNGGTAVRFWPADLTYDYPKLNTRIIGYENTYTAPSYTYYPRPPTRGTAPALKYKGLYTLQASTSGSTTADCKFYLSKPFLQFSNYTIGYGTYKTLTKWHLFNGTAYLKEIPITAASTVIGKKGTDSTEVVLSYDVATGKATMFKVEDVSKSEWTLPKAPTLIAPTYIRTLYIADTGIAPYAVFVQAPTTELPTTRVYDYDQLIFEDKILAVGDKFIEHQYSTKFAKGTLLYSEYGMVCYWDGYTLRLVGMFVKMVFKPGVINNIDIDKSYITWYEQRFANAFNKEINRV